MVLVELLLGWSFLDWVFDDWCLWLAFLVIIILGHGKNGPWGADRENDSHEGNHQQFLDRSGVVASSGPAAGARQEVAPKLRQTKILH